MLKELLLSVNEENSEKLKTFLSSLEQKFKVSTDLNSASDNCKDVLLIGGDGSINYLLNSLKSFNRYRVLYIPYGTANDFAKSLKLEPIEPTVELVEQVLVNSPTVDVPIMSCNDKKLINVATGGAPAEVTESGSDFLKKATGKFSYYVAAIEKAISPDIIKFEYKLDNDETWTKITSPGFSVSQGMYAGGGVKLTESMTPNFGEKFNFLSFVGEELTKGAGELLKMQKRDYVREENSEGITSKLVTRLELKSSLEIPLKLDGEDYKNDHLVFKKLDEKLKFYIY